MRNYITVEVRRQGKTSRVKIGKGASIAELLEKLGINRETVIVRKNGEIASEEDALGSKIDIIGVISGG